MVPKACPSCQSITDSDNIYRCQHCSEWFCLEDASESIEGCLSRYVVFRIEGRVNATHRDEEWELKRGKFFWECPQCNGWMHLKYGHGRQSNLVAISQPPESYLEETIGQKEGLRTVGKVREHK